VVVRLLYLIFRQVLAWLGLLACSARSKNAEISCAFVTRSPCAVRCWCAVRRSELKEVPPAALGPLRLSRSARLGVTGTADTAATPTRLSAVDQFGQVIAVLVSQNRDLAATHRFFTRALEHGPSPTEVITDKAAVYPPVVEEIAPGAWHHTEPYANNRIESDHGRLKSRLRPMRGLKQLRCAQVISAGHAFIQNLRRGHYELGTEETVNLRVLAAFDELTLAI
jgi:IS6 family transposase